MIQEVRNVEKSESTNVPVKVQTVPAARPARPASATLARTDLRKIAGEDRLQLIAEAAYFRAEQRGFQPGQELEDWLAAEIEIDALLGEDDGRA